MQFFVLEVHCQKHPKDFWYEGFDESGTLRWKGDEWDVIQEIEKHVQPIDMVTTIYTKRVIHQTCAEFKESVKKIRRSINNDPQ